MHNNHDILTILNSISSSPPLLFLGAGAASCRDLPERERLPLGDTVKTVLLQKFYGESDPKAAELRFRKDFNIDDQQLEVSPELIWGEILSKNDTDIATYHQILSELFNHDKPVPPTYRLIAKLCFNEIIDTIITTNFDERLDDAFKSILKIEADSFDKKSLFFVADESDFKHCVDSKDELIKNLKIVYKLHGTLSKPYTIKASEDDLKSLSENKLKTLEKILNNHSYIIFLGYSCKDDDIFKALKTIKINNKKIYWMGRSKAPSNEKISEIIKYFKDTKNFSKYIGNIDSMEFIRHLYDNQKKEKKLNFKMIQFPERDFIKNISHTKTKTVTTFRTLDPIYGEIDFNVFEDIKLKRHWNKVVARADMQRLRDIRQLPFTQYLYPGATHTRFSHSLGVAYLTSKVLKNFVDSKHLNIREHFEDIQYCIDAALLHDIGHGPFGHVLDTFVERIGKEDEIQHENIGTKIISEGLIDQGPENDYDAERVNQFITGKELEPECMFFHSLIGDYALDLDRIDFLLRDSYFTGLLEQGFLQTDQTNLINQENFFNKNMSSLIERKSIIDHLIKSYTLVSDRTICNHSEKCDDRPVLAFIENPENKQTVNNFLELYTYMYTEVYHNETNFCAQSMVAKALECSYKSRNIEINEIYKFTDAGLFTYLEKSENSIIKQLMWGVKYGKFFKTVHKFSPPQHGNVMNLEKKLKEGLELSEDKYQDTLIVAMPKKKVLKNIFLTDGQHTRTFPHLDVFNQKLEDNRCGYVFVPFDSKIQEEEIKTILGTEDTSAFSCK